MFYSIPFPETILIQVTAKILEILREIMSENRVGKFDGWLPDPFGDAKSFRKLDDENLLA